MKVLGKYLNPEEIVTGAVHAGVWIPFLGWWAALGVPLSGFLWAWGGAEDTSKSWRRWGVPITICGLIALAKLSWIPLIGIPLGLLVLSKGYGIPSWNGPGGTMDDEGSQLGRWAYMLVKGEMTGPDKRAEKNATMVVRAVLALLFGVAMLPLAFIAFGWWLLGTLLLTILIPLVVALI